MRSIMVLNPKGGSGKSTLATNLASYYASEDMDVVLADLDHQGSSLAWLKARPAGRPPIRGIAAWRSSAARPSRGTDVVIYDAPAAVHGRDLAALLRKAETYLVPVLPSPIDMRAAADFVAYLKHNSRVANKQIKIALVANKVREYTNIFLELEEFLKRQRVTVAATLRDSMNYVRAAERGLGVFEMAPYLTAVDREQWAPLLSFLRSKRSRA